MPFGPFFVVFGHVVADPAAWTTEQDLQLLEGTMAYFNSMRAQLSLLSSLSARLARTARVFARLARNHVDYYVVNTSLADTALNGLTDEDLANIERYLAWLPANVTDSLPSAAFMPDVDASTKPGVAAEAGAGETSADQVFDWFAWDQYYAQNAESTLA